MRGIQDSELVTAVCAPTDFLNCPSSGYVIAWLLSIPDAGPDANYDCVTESSGLALSYTFSIDPKIWGHLSPVSTTRRNLCWACLAICHGGSSQMSWTQRRWCLFKNLCKFFSKYVFCLLCREVHNNKLPMWFGLTYCFPFDQKVHWITPWCQRFP
jgi:hypothetical protein